MLQSLRNALAENPVSFTYLRKLLELNFLREKKIVRKSFDLSSPNRRILDIGCGTGEFASLFTNQNYIGIDISPTYIEYAKKKNKGEFLVMDAKKLEFGDASFDCILIMATLHHLSDDDVNKVMSESKRVLRSGGKVLIIEHSQVAELENWLSRLIQKFDKGDFIRTPEEYKNVLRPFFSTSNEKTFRSGGVTYFSVLLQ